VRKDSSGLAYRTIRDTGHVIDSLLHEALDSIFAILDTLQNVNSALRVDTASAGGSLTAAEIRDTLLRTDLPTYTDGGVTGSIFDSLLGWGAISNEVDTIVLACVNGDTVSNTADFLKTMLDYREQIKRKLNIATSNTTYMTDSVFNQLIREAIVKVNPIMRGVKVRDTFVTSWQTSDYNLDSMIGIIGVTWQHEDTVVPLTYMPLEGWGTLRQKTTFGADDPYLSRPSVYDVTDNQVMLFPPPTLDDTIELVGFRKIHGIAVTSDVSAIPQAYRIPVLNYAAYIVAFSKQHPRAGDLMQEYKMSINDLMQSLNRRPNVPTTTP
jgi:hypothetical protein